MGLEPSGKCYESSRIHLQYETDYFLSFLSFWRNFFGGTWNWRGTDSWMPNRLSYGREYWVWWEIVYRRGHPTSQSRSENTQLQNSGRYSYTNIHNLHLTSPWGRPLLRAWASRTIGWRNFTLPKRLARGQLTDWSPQAISTGERYLGSHIQTPEIT